MKPATNIIQATNQSEKLVSSEIKSITAFEENQYRLWNFFLRSIVNDDIFNVEQLDLDGMIENQNIEFLLDKDLLFDLFVAKLNQRDYLENSLKKFTYLKAEDYPSLLDYEAAISDLASEIIITIHFNKFFSNFFIYFSLNKSQKINPFI